MLQRSIQLAVAIRLVGLCALCAALSAVGCQSNNPQQVASSNGPWQTMGTGSADAMNQLQDLFVRQDAQSKLAAQQRQALSDLADWQRQQEQQLGALADEKNREKIAELQNQAAIVAQQKHELEQLAELRRQALELDSNNRDLHAQLAQTEQQNRLLEDQMQLLRRQLDDAAQQLAASLETQQQTEQRILAAQNESQQRLAEVQRDADQRVSALQANLQRKGSATITANNSLQRSLTPISIAGLLVRQDGDVVRIELPADRIFAPGTAAFGESATELLDQVATAVRNNYAQQMIGIEAHTDSGPMQGSAWRNQHQLTAAQAMAVFELFAQRHQFPAQQMFVLGHGANYPVASNATADGQQRNRRVEVVIYPETVGQR